MHCTVKKTLETIVETKNEYIICVKKNQMCLFKELERLSSCWSARIDYFKKEEINRDRKEIRKVYVYPLTSKIKQEWCGAKQFVKIIRIRKTKKKEEIHVHYYLSSQQKSARYYMDTIRKHWGIENQLHWVKDVVMKEDAWRVKYSRAASVMSIFKTICLNLFRSQERSDCTNFIYESADNIELLKALLE
jgi:predicted transposase YbfD/YdcC